MLQPAAPESSSGENVSAKMVPTFGLPLTSIISQYVVPASSSIPSPEAVNVLRPAISEAGFVRLPSEFAPGAPFESGRMSTV